MTKMQDESNINNDDSSVAMTPRDERVLELYGGRAQDFYDFHLERRELITLAKYWAEAAIGAEYATFLYSCYGSDWNRDRSFGWARVERIRDLLGEEVDGAIDEVYQTFAAKQDNQAWEIYLHGSEAERAALQEEIQRRMEKPRWRLITKLRRRMLKFILRR